MIVSELLKKIRDPWLTRISHELGRGEGGRILILEELNRFYDMLLEAVETGDPGWLKPILIEWASSRTETELSGEVFTLSPVLSTIVMDTISVARGILSDKEVVDLMDALLPMFNYSYEQVARHESMVRTNYISTRMEQAQRELEKLERSKSDFIAVAGHELKTPLTLIEGYSSMLKDQLGKIKDNDGPIQLLMGVDNGIRRLGEIINDMIDVSMIDNNLLTLNFQPTWINRLLDGLEKDLKDHFDERNQKLEITAFEGSDTMTFADSERIYQALGNVLMNAIKFTPDGGQISVDGRILSGFIEVLVTDTGIGIDPEFQSRIFEKFGVLGDIALHSSSKINFKGGGPGLGLPITKGILEAHGGSIWVDSDGSDEEKMPGATFHILIPIRDEPPDKEIAKLFKKSADENPAADK